MIKLYKGDCLDIMPGIPSGSVDMILADLPYGTTNCRWDFVIPLNLLWLEYGRLIKSDGAVVLFAQSPFDKTLGVSSSLFKYEWIWEKTQATGHLNAKKMPMKAHENILVFYNKQPTYNPQKTQGHKRKVSTAEHKRNTSTGDVYGKCNNFSDYDSTDRYPRDVLLFASDKQKLNLHATQKPVALCEYLIKTYTDKGDTVLDNVMGSGTTGIACLNTGRKFIGIEKDEKYYKIAENRILNNLNQ